MILVLFLAAAIATPLIARLARRVGVTDLRLPGERHRKPREEQVPPIGGLVLLLGLCYWGVRTGDTRWLQQGSEVPWLALFAAFLLGFVDDLRGMKPALKLTGQLLIGIAYAWQLGSEGPQALLQVLAVVIACNAANTFDNSDGVLAGTSLLFLYSFPAAAALVAGFLPSNWLIRRGKERVPLAYLGDSGSHMLGVLLLLTPAGLFALMLPLLDLLRLSIVRLRVKSWPWIGDRRHLAHRLEKRFSPPILVVIMVLIALPGALGCAHLYRFGDGHASLAWIGAAATAVLFMLAVMLTEEPKARSMA
ncbi:MAG: UDP-GlcNAc:undecaprenyl-phosphate GlcNAc-1-phosphate transferase [Planctomycetota bacterium]|jgi:UDP-GlcNAc:undecaprenyl-phosphate GlcNAc-1-phosphate transferase